MTRCAASSRSVRRDLRLLLELEIEIKRYIDDKSHQKSLDVMTPVINCGILMRKTPLGRLSRGEFEIMNVVWDSGECTVPEVMNRVNQRRPVPLKRATIQVKLRRLEEKGWVRHEERNRRFFYSPTTDRRAASAELADDLTARVFDGSCTEMVRCLFEHEKITPEEIARLRRLLDEVD